MKFVIPAKRSSTRVPDKNFRAFSHGKSLLDVLVEKLRDLGDPGDVYISSEDNAVTDIAKRHGAAFLPRDPRLTENSYPFQSVVQQVCRQLPDDDDVMWCHTTDPFFEEHHAVVQSWQERDPRHSSITVVYPMKEYLLDPDHNPLGFGFGPWHRPSQELPTHYALGFTCSIMTRSVATNVGLVGPSPTWFEASNLTIDIDTQPQFDLASRLHELIHIP